MPYPTSRSSFDIYRDGETTLDISLMVKLVLVVRGFRGQLDERLRKIGQSTSRMETLSAILNMKDPKSQSDVAKRLRVEGAAVTRMDDILSKEGLVERTPDPGDRRVNLLSITAAGEEALAAIFQVYDTMRTHLLSDLANAEKREMHRVFDLMMGRLENPPGDAMEIEDLPRIDRLTDKVEKPDDVAGFHPSPKS